MKKGIFKAALILLILFIAGCAESNFNIAKESRLPKWFTLPPGLSRQDVTVTLDYYTVPPQKSVFTLMDKKGNKLSVKSGKRYGLYLSPRQLKNPPPGFLYPNSDYEIIVVDGVVDIIEHRYRNNIFYVTDDPVVWNELGPKQQK